MKNYGLFIDNEWVKSDKEEEEDVINPANEQKIATIQKGTVEDTKAAIDAARTAFDRGEWPRLSPATRAESILKLSRFLEDDIIKFGETEMANTGKPVKQVVDYDVAYTIDNLRFFAGAARTIDGVAAKEYVTDGTSILRREPRWRCGSNHTLELSAYDGCMEGNTCNSGREYGCNKACNLHAIDDA
ncbi:MAG: gamma-aminobutyraldehyde dehydrogenase [Thermoplasmatales archaeon I-plasma]|nr:MAG: gamma-aminobutyraldehyde dehydrogenase [Thermoplasmatales archaeon I-plasma]